MIIKLKLSVAVYHLEGSKNVFDIVNAAMLCLKKSRHTDVRNGRYKIKISLQNY